MLVIGRVTKDAIIKHISDDQQVVEFSIAENYFYRRKGDAKAVQQTTFYNVSYWISTGIATRLKTGTVVEIFGQLNAKAYTNMHGEPKPSLNVHADLIKIHTTGSSAAVDKQGTTHPDHTEVLTHEPIDDLPF